MARSIKKGPFVDGHLMKKVEAAQAAKDAARVTGRTFIIDPAVQGRVSVVTQRPLSTSEYFELFLSTMRAQAAENEVPDVI